MVKWISCDICNYTTKGKMYAHEQSDFIFLLERYRVENVAEICKGCEKKLSKFLKVERKLQEKDLDKKVRAYINKLKGKALLKRNDENWQDHEFYP